jgi:hypothetical protein
VNEQTNNFTTNNGYQYITNGLDYQDYPQGIMINKIKLVPNTPVQLRAKTLYNIGLNILGLNPHFTKDDVAHYLFGINYTKLFIPIPLPASTLNRVINNVFKQQGSIELKPNTLVYTVYGKDCEMTKQERRTHTNQFTGQRKTKKNQQVIHDAIISISDCKITALLISEKTGLGLGVVKRNWSEFKDLVKSVNLAIKAPVTNDVIEMTPEAITEETIQPASLEVLEEDEDAMMLEYLERMNAKHKLNVK